MAEIINLNKFRKQRKQRQKTASASQNRASHGQTKAEKHTLLLENKRAKKTLEDKRLEKPGDKKNDSE